MDIQQWLRKAETRLKESSVISARLDAEILLSDTLNRDRSWLHAHSDEELEPLLLARGLASSKLNDQVERRTKHEPLAYIRGIQEFYGREFRVTPDVLTPRPETEDMVELLLELLQNPRSKIQDLSIIDIGTGSGCIIISAALELSKIQDPKYTISCQGLDISEKALKIARQNAIRLKADVDFKKFNLLKNDLPKIQDSRSTVYLANLPYVPEKHPINEAAKHEPGLAIFGGEDGLDYYRELFIQLPIQSTVDSKNNTRSTVSVLTESLEFQHKDLEVIAKKAGYELEITKGLVQLFKKN